MQVVERAQSVQVLAEGGQLLASFESRPLADAFVQGFRRGSEWAREVAKAEIDATGLTIARMTA